MSQDTNGERIQNLEERASDMEKRFAEAFPGGDHIGHCRYHQLMIEDIAERKRLRAAIMEKTVAGLVWSLIIGIVLSGFAYLKAMLKG